MLLNKLQQHYNQSLEVNREVPVTDPLPDNEPEQEKNKSVLNFDVKDLMDGIWAEYYKKVQPVLKENEGLLPCAAIPVIEEALNQIDKIEQNEEFMMYLKFRLKQLVLSKTTNEDNEDNIFKEI